VRVLRDEVPEGPVAWLTQTGEVSATTCCSRLRSR